jgi:chemotaxis signal transduction protein
MQTYLLCEIGGQRFAFDVEKVHEAVRMPWVTPVAETPDDVCGVVNYRGRCIAVVDPAIRLVGHPCVPGVDSYLVIWQLEREQVALVVDRVESLLQAEPKAAPRDVAASRFVRGHIDDGKGLCTVLDVVELLRPDVKEFVVRAGESGAPPP